jgi:NADPH2:quinone reductase
MTIRVVATAFGGPEVLRVVHGTVGEPGPGEIAVAVRAVGINPIDFKLYSGLFGDDPSQLPMPLGSEASGVVTAVGEGAQGPTGVLGVGDEVILYRISGAYASEVVVPGEAALHKPQEMSFEEASGLMLTGATAVHALSVVKATSGETLLLHGASGGFGLMAVQLAVADGIRVIGTASGSNHERLRALGAIPVAYGEGLLERIQALAPNGVDAALDGVGTDEALDVSVALVADRARIATIAGSRRGFELGVKVLGGGPGADAGVEIRAAARLELVHRVTAGTLRVLVDKTYPLIEAAVAHRELATGHTRGKIALIP